MERVREETRGWLRVAKAFGLTWRRPKKREYANMELEIIMKNGKRMRDVYINGQTLLPLVADED